MINSCFVVDWCLNDNDVYPAVVCGLVATCLLHVCYITFVVHNFVWMLVNTRCLAVALLQFKTLWTCHSAVMLLPCCCCCCSESAWSLCGCMLLNDMLLFACLVGCVMLLEACSYELNMIPMPCCCLFCFMMIITLRMLSHAVRNPKGLCENSDFEPLANLLFYWLGANQNISFCLAKTQSFN